VNRIHAALFLLTLLAACAGESEGVRAAGSALSAEDAQASETSAARAATPDSLVEALLGDRDPDPAPPPTSPRLPPQEQANQPLSISEMGYDEGSPSAPVKVMELSDFGCGYCRLFHQQTFPTLRKIYIESGLVEWKHIPLRPGDLPQRPSRPPRRRSAPASRMGSSRCSRPSTTPRREWRASQDPHEFFSGLAEREGLDVERFRLHCRAGGGRDDVRPMSAWASRPGSEAPPPSSSTAGSCRAPSPWRTSGRSWTLP
jgi:hypothetical protein